MVGIDFDFGRYIAHRRGLMEKRVRDGAAYSFAGERKVRRALIAARPVTLALEATSRQWRSKGKDELLGASVKASDRDFPAVYAAARAAAARLDLAMPPVFVQPADRARVSAAALGVDDDAVVIISEPLTKRLSHDELTSVLAHELSHIQNEHILYVTALYYLRHESFLPIRWAAQPAIVALSAWARRAALTCDRGALLAAGSLDVAMMALCKVEDPNITTEAAQELIARSADSPTQAGMARYKELFRSHPDIGKRLRAMRIFATTTFYLRATGDAAANGISTEDADHQVSELLKVFA